MTLRILVTMFSLAVSAGAQEQLAKTLTAAQIVDRIKQHTGLPWEAGTVDTVKAGDPDTPITGIATTMMATYDVLERAARSGKNLIITHEPTFYNHLDKTEVFEKENDAVWAQKLKLIHDRHLVVWRFHDYWHMRKPDGILTGVVRALGWQERRTGEGASRFKLDQTTLGALASEMKQKLGIQIVRVVGDPAMTVSSVALSPGAAGTDAHRRLLQLDDVEVLAIGEVPEWETIEYVNDAAAEGRKKALILLGHIPSEQPGMEYCAEWLKSFITEVPVEFVPTREPFWLAK